MTSGIDRFFEQRPQARMLFEAVDSVMQGIGPATLHVAKSQIAYLRRRSFAWVWTPDRWLKGKTAPRFLSVQLLRRDASERWKEVVEPYPGRWMHHLELRDPGEIDDQVRVWLREAYQDAG